MVTDRRTKTVVIEFPEDLLLAPEIPLRGLVLIHAPTDTTDTVGKQEKVMMEGWFYYSHLTLRDVDIRILFHLGVGGMWLQPEQDSWHRVETLAPLGR